MRQDKLIIFDFWQTLADAKIRPSALFDIFIHHSLHSDFFYSLSHSDVFLKEIDTEITLFAFLKKFGIKQEDDLKMAFFIWQKMAASSYLIDGAHDLICDLKSRGYRLCIMSNVDKYGYEHFPYQHFFKYFDYTFQEN